MQIGRIDDFIEYVSEMFAANKSPVKKLRCKVTFPSTATLQATLGVSPGQIVDFLCSIQTRLGRSIWFGFKRVPEVDRSCRLLVLPLFRGSSRFETLILSRRSRFNVTF